MNFHLVEAPTSLLNNWDSAESGEILKFFKDNYFETEKIRGRVNKKAIERLKTKDEKVIIFTRLRKVQQIIYKVLVQYKMIYSKWRNSQFRQKN